MSEIPAESAFDGDAQSVNLQPRAEHSGFSSTRSLILLLLVAVCVTGLSFGLSQQRRKPTNCGLVVDQRDLDFGEVWAQSEFEWTLPVSNITPRDIEIRDIRKSCNCTVIEPKSLVIRAGGSAQIQLKLDLRTSSPEESALPVRNFVVQLFPRISRRQSFEEVVWEVTGRVRQPVSVSPAKIGFPDVLVGGNPPTAQTVRVKCHDAVEALTAECDHPSVMIQLVELAETPLTYDLVVDLVKTLPASDLKCNIVLRAVSQEGETLPDVTVPVSGRVLERIAFAPERLTMGTLKVGQRGTKWVKLWSRTGESFTVNDVQTESPLVEIVEQAVDDGKGSNGYPFTVSLVAAKLGAQTTKVRFVVQRAGADTPTKLSLPVSYYGTSGDP